MRLTTTIAVAAALVFAAAPALADKGGNGNGNGGNGNGGGDGNGPTTAVITVPDAEYAGMTTATVNRAGADMHVFVQCYAPDSGGTYVYAAYFPVDSSNHAAVGPLWSTLWPRGDASCQAQEGYFTRDGFGRWESVATTTFRVTG